jgi:hypothetical protein
VVCTDDRLSEEAYTLGTVNFQRDFKGYRSVFASGDSYTQGTGLPADMSYPAQLDFELNVGPKGYEKRLLSTLDSLPSVASSQSSRSIDIERIGIPDYVLYLDAQMTRKMTTSLGGYRHLRW